MNEYNGPLVFIPRSHARGPLRTALDSTTTSYPLWTVDNDIVAGLVAEGGLFSATGPAGTGLIFGDCLVHGSPPNMSPWDRRIFSLIVNPVSNALTKFQTARLQAPPGPHAGDAAGRRLPPGGHHPLRRLRSFLTPLA